MIPKLSEGVERHSWLPAAPDRIGGEFNQPERDCQCGIHRSVSVIGGNWEYPDSSVRDMAIRFLSARLA
jgi:hypothetical protein